MSLWLQVLAMACSIFGAWWFLKEAINDFRHEHFIFAVVEWTAFVVCLLVLGSVMMAGPPT